jgi:hypothetical protein
MGSSGGLFCALVLFSSRASSQASLGMRDTFTRARLTPDEIREVIAVIERSAYDTPESWTKELRVRRVDLGVSSGLIVQGTSLLCGATGNCQIFALRKANRHWVSLFQDNQEVIADTFTFGPGAAHGIPDLTLTANVGADAEYHVRFMFDGRFYRTQ